ncbi:hypothetical protein BJY01DRAFT_254699 [Aspergillus pseudoustus]|uniref:Uncharacterized protein n=1 Tax=Aspergillus pseudoustus TaxID=1810923 RepID=A0ABR4IU02_9EURO
MASFASSLGIQTATTLQTAQLPSMENDAHFVHATEALPREAATENTQSARALVDSINAPLRRFTKSAVREARTFRDELQDSATSIQRSVYDFTELAMYLRQEFGHINGTLQEVDAGVTFINRVAAGLTETVPLIQEAAEMTRQAAAVTYEHTCNPRGPAAVGRDSARDSVTVHLPPSDDGHITPITISSSSSS